MRVCLGVHVVSALGIGDHSGELLLPLVCCEDQNAQENDSKETGSGLLFTEDHGPFNRENATQHNRQCP